VNKEYGEIYQEVLLSGQIFNLPNNQHLVFSRRSQKKEDEKNKENRIQGFINGVSDYKK